MIKYKKVKVKVYVSVYYHLTIVNIIKLNEKKRRRQRLILFYKRRQSVFASVRQL
jgi:hypothetical protein